MIEQANLNFLRKIKYPARWVPRTRVIAHKLDVSPKGPLMAQDIGGPQRPPMGVKIVGGSQSPTN